MQTGILHTHLSLQPCLRSLAGGQEHGPTGEREEHVPSLTLLMYSVPKDSPGELSVPFASQQSPIQPAHPRVC